MRWPGYARPMLPGRAGQPTFVPARPFIAQLPTPPSGGFSPGGHDGAFWSSQLPAEIAWMAPILTS